MSKKNFKPTARKASPQPVKPVLPVSRGYASYGLPGILVLTFVVFFPSLKNQFVNWDDYAYIVDNPVIKDLSLGNILNIFNIHTYVVGNYHPLTVLSYCLEYRMVQVKPFLYHLDNILLHLANVALVFSIARRLSGSLPAALITALLFAIHPMRVESVTWAAERKDVLYTLFFLLSTYTYLRYMTSRNTKFYILSILLFLFSILSKGQAVVLPLTLLLIDFYQQRKLTSKAFLEKIPYFALSLLFGIIAMFAQHTSLTAERLARHSFLERAFFASYGLLQYLYKLALPVKLSCFYGYPGKSGGSYPLMVYLAPLIVIGMLYLLYRLRSRTFLAFGALYFLFTISIVLQFLPVGDAIVADRYTYIPYTGLFFAIGILVSKLIERYRSNIYLIPFIALYFVILSMLSFSRTKDWKNSETLWSNVIRNYPETPIAYNDRGVIELEQNRLEEALADFNNAIKYNPLYFEAWNNRGNTYGKLKRYKEEIADYTRAVLIAPSYTTAYFNRGLAYVNAGDPAKALVDYDQVLKAEPDNAKCYYSKGIAYKDLHQDSLAIVNYTKAVALNPLYEEAYTNKGNVYFRQGQYDKALVNYNKALEVSPASGNAYYNRSAAYFGKKEYTKALEDALKAQSLGYTVDAKYIEFIKFSMQNNK